MKAQNLAWVLAAIVVLSEVGVVPGAEPEAHPQDAAAAADSAVAAVEPAVQPAVIYLERSLVWRLRAGTDNQYLGPLARELVRQAVLIAAREELGLVTRDGWLGDPMFADSPTQRVDLSAKAGDPSPVTLWLRHGEEWHKEFEFTLAPDDVADFGRLTAVTEELSRLTFPAVLREAGYPDVADPRFSEAAVPQEIEDLLAEMTFLTQHQAVRKLHALIRTQGESPPLLGALVRGYANLGMLTEFYWHPAHKVFRARAMLYAQRLLVREPDSIWAHWQRAYAMAMTGLHKLALDDLETAGRLREATTEGERPQPPPWVDVIDAYCRYDVARLRPRQAAAAVKELTCVLLIVALDEGADGRATIDAALEILPTMQDCYRIWEATCTSGGVALWHSTTLSPLSVVGQTLYERLKAMPDLPESARQVVRKRAAPEGFLAKTLGVEEMSLTEEFELRRSLVAALLATGLEGTDTGMPSWASLGQLIGELSFVHVWRRANFERNSLGASADDFIEVAAPLVADHRLYPLIESFTLDPAKRREAIERLVEADLNGQDLTASRVVDVLREVNPARAKEFSGWRYFSVDNIARDLSTKCGLYIDDVAASAAHLLRKVSPYNPQARARLIEYDWENVKDEAPGWEQEFSQHALPLLMLGKHYSDEGRFADAERCLKAAVDISHLRLSHTKLAEVYKRQGMIDKAVATLEKYCEYPEYGLGHGEVHKTIARYYVSAGQWQKALPYAEEAASTGSSWGVLCLADCYEGLQQWQKAEDLTRATAQRYRTDRPVWYFFCRRTGHGDLDAARTFAERYLQDYDPAVSEVSAFRVAVFYILEEHPEKALEIMEQAYAEKNIPVYTLLIALLADELALPEKRDAALQQVVAYGPAHATDRQVIQYRSLVGLAGLLTEDLAKGGKGEIRPQAANAVRDLSGNIDDTNCDYFLGMYFSLRGKEAEAVEYWKDCMRCIPEDTSMRSQARTLAGAALHQRGIDPEQYMPLPEETGSDDEP